MHAATLSAGRTRRLRTAHDCWQRGVQAARDSRWDRAERAFGQAVHHHGDDPLYWLNLAHARLKLNRFGPAADAARRAAGLGADPDTAAAMLAQALFGLNRLDEAIEAVARLDAAAAADPALLTRQSEALTEQGRAREAIRAAMRALSIDPGHADAHVALAVALDRLGMPAEAAEALRTSLVLVPDSAMRLGSLIHMAQKAMDWRRLDADIAALRGQLAAHGHAAASPFAWLNLTDDAAEQLAISRRHARAEFGAIEPMPPVRPAQRRADRRIRLGYLSNDFRMHATALLLAQVLEQRDRDAFHLTLYSHSQDDGSALRARVIAAADAFVEIGAMTDADAAQRIRDDRIDILVDLKGYTRGARTGILARRPAPVQVNWLGFPGSMGAPFIDYLIGDPIVTPPQAADRYDEQLALLPDCYQPNDRLREIGPTPPRAACGLPDGAFVFASFNNSYKITPPMFELWCALLRERPRSVLWLLEWNGSMRAHLVREAAARGVDASRLVFGAMLSSEDNLGRLRNADLALDTFPVNGHTTTSDALWAGVPVLTLAGQAFASRVAASLLHAAGLPELVATDADDYRQRALALSADASALRALRERLRAGRDHCALFDTARFASHLEQLYRRMFERWQAGLPPARLSA